MTGQITLVADQKHYAIAFERGAIVAACSPSVGDSVLRVALTSHLVGSSQIGELTRRLTANPQRDEVDIVGEVARLSPAQLDKLRTELTVRRAARTFAVEDGPFVIDDCITIPTSGCSVDIRTVLYYGIRMHMSDTRMSSDLRMLGGSYFVLHQAPADIAKLGFSDDEAPLLATLRKGATIPELEARHRDIDPRAMLAAICTLVAVGAVQVTAPPAAAHPSPSLPPPPPPPPSPPSPPPSGLTSSSRASQFRVPSAPIVAQTQLPPRGRRSSNAQPYVALARGTRDFQPPPKTNAELAAEVAARASRALAADKPEAAVPDLKKAIELVPNDVDYNALLGWALFCAADDKAAVAEESRRLLEKAVHRSQRPEVARFYLGRVERMLGRDREALRHFQAVLDLEPNNRDASAEVRILEARLRRLG